jgi:hypothetical protein
MSHNDKEDNFPLPATLKGKRKHESLRNRFQRSIAKQTKEWNPFYKSIAQAPPSGTTKEDWISIASEEYNNQYGRRFSFQHCIEILHQLLKFDPMIGVASMVKKAYMMMLNLLISMTQVSLWLRTW